MPPANGGGGGLSSKDRGAAAVSLPEVPRRGPGGRQRPSGAEDHGHRPPTPAAAPDIDWYDDAEGRLAEAPEAAPSGAASRSLSRPASPAVSGRPGAGASLRSSASAPSLRGTIEEAVKEEVRSALADYLALKRGKLTRKVAKAMERPPHLRPAPNPIDMGCMPSYESETRCSLRVPVQKASDPKWSTDLKRINDKVGQRIEYERRLSAAVGVTSPELRYMYPKPYVSNPPTPYFVPGQRPH